MRIEVAGVTKRFGNVLALDGVGFELSAGRRAALVGPNGSGKSTLNRVLMGLVACEGEVLLDGRSPFRERVAIARRMAYVPQIAPQIAAPVEELLSAVTRVRGIAPSALRETAEALDLDLEALGRRPFRSLSGGTRQKLLIALAFATEAALLLLDEPTGSLDARSREHFFRLFESLPGSTTLVLCSHRLDEIRPLVDHVLLLEEGRLAYAGAAEAFLERCALSVLEVRAEGAAAAEWLVARGFRRGHAGTWRRTVDRVAKMTLLPELTQALGTALLDMSARDLETLDPVLAPGEEPLG